MSDGTNGIEMEEPMEHITQIKNAVPGGLAAALSALPEAWEAAA